MMPTTTESGPVRGGQTPATGAVGGPVPGAPAGGRRRRGLLTIAAGVLVVAVGALLGLAVHTSTTASRPVLVLARDVARGATLTPADLRVVEVTADGVDVVGAARLGEVVGTTALHRLSAGSVLSEQSTGQPTIATGRVTIGLLLAPGHVPSTGLEPGAPVTVHRVSGAKGGTGVGGRPASVAARVVAVGPAAEGEAATALDVEIERHRAAELAAWSAAGEVAVVGEAG